MFLYLFALKKVSQPADTEDHRADLRLYGFEGRTSCHSLRFTRPKRHIVSFSRLLWGTNGIREYPGSFVGKPATFYQLRG